MSDTDKRVALAALRHRTETLADSIVRTDRARRRLAVAFKACMDANASQDDIDGQVRLAIKDNPERSAALEHAGLINVER